MACYRVNFIFSAFLDASYFTITGLLFALALFVFHTIPRTVIINLHGINRMAFQYRRGRFAVL
jgi:hypothetical protein